MCFGREKKSTGLTRRRKINGQLAGENEFRSRWRAVPTKVRDVLLSHKIYSALSDLCDLCATRLAGNEEHKAFSLPDTTGRYCFAVWVSLGVSSWQSGSRRRNYQRSPLLVFCLVFIFRWMDFIATLTSQLCKCCLKTLQVLRSKWRPRFED